MKKPKAKQDSGIRIVLLLLVLLFSVLTTIIQSLRLSNLQSSFSELSTEIAVLQMDLNKTDFVVNHNGKALNDYIINTEKEKTRKRF